MPVTVAVGGRVRAEDVLAHVEGGLDEMSEDEQMENTALAERHEELLKSHGYRLVRVTSVMACLCCRSLKVWRASACPELSMHFKAVQDVLGACIVRHAQSGLDRCHAGVMRECHALSLYRLRYLPACISRDRYEEVSLMTQVEGLPGYVLEPDSRGVRELERKYHRSESDGNSPDVSAMTDASEVS